MIKFDLQEKYMQKTTIRTKQERDVKNGKLKKGLCSHCGYVSNIKCWLVTDS